MVPDQRIRPHKRQPSLTPAYAGDRSCWPPDLSHGGRNRDETASAARRCRCWRWRWPALLTGRAGQGGERPAVATAGNGGARGAAPSAAPSDAGQGPQVRPVHAGERHRHAGPGAGATGPRSSGGKGGPASRAGSRAEGDQDEGRGGEEKCRELLPNGGEPPSRHAEQLEQMREFAKCMREQRRPNSRTPTRTAAAVDPDRSLDMDPRPSRQTPTKKAMRQKCRPGPTAGRP